MADTEVKIGENTPEYFAFRLMEMIRGAEDKFSDGKGNPDRQWILRTYA
jgi:hypothetical protein